MRLIDADKAKEKLRGNAQKDGDPFVGAVVEMFANFWIRLRMRKSAAKSGKAAADESRVIEIVRAGVVQLPGFRRSFTVNGESIEEYIRGEVEKRRPVRDQYGNFAGKATESLKNVIDAFEHAVRCVRCVESVPEGWQV